MHHSYPGLSAGRYPLSTLLIDLPSGPRRRVEHHEVVRFGRDPRLELPLSGPEDRTMSRHVGTFRFHGDDWWVERPEPGGRARSGPLEVMGIDGSGLRSVPPGGASVLRGAGAVAFPPRRYTLRFRVEGHRPTPGRSGGGTVDDPLGGATTMPVVSITARQVDYVVALAEPELRHTPSARRRQLDEIAALWGVRREAVEAALRLLRSRLVEAQLLEHGDNGQIGVNDVVARIAVSHGLVTMADLEWAALYRPGGPRPAAGSPRFARETTP
jgi:hypothetical protein